MNNPTRTVPNVVLTGFMGTGKSTVGRVLADRLGFDWVDTDSLIASRHGPIAAIFDTDGEEAFRDLERTVASELADRTGLVVSTGGRMMLDAEIAALLTRNSRVFCLVATPQEVLRRISGADAVPRPLLAGGHPTQRITDLLAERAAGYRQFEQVETDGKTAAEVADELLDRLLG